MQTAPEAAVEISKTRYRAGALALMLACAAGALVGCEKPPTSDADRAFDKTLNAALARRLPIDLTRLESGEWSRVCAIGEDRPASMLAGQRARPGERAFDSLIDPGGALAFLHPDGVEVRPLSRLTIGMGAPLNRCVERRAAVLIDTPDEGWRFR